jgi:hypothetical protein
MSWAPLLAIALAANPDLDKAAKLVADLQYAEAQGALDAALKRPGNDRDTMLRIYELQGIVYGTLNQSAKAVKAFQALLTLAPDHKLTGDNPPRVMTPFYEARGRAADTGRLDAKALPAAMTQGRVAQLAVEVTSDPLKMVKKVRFHLKVDDKAWAEQVTDVVGRNASVSTDANEVKWYAELLGDREAALFELGNAAAPRTDGSAPVAKSEIKAAPSEEVSAPPAPPAASATAEVSSGTSGVRVAAYGVFAAGVVGLGVGAALGIVSFMNRNTINNAMRDSNGNVTGLTQTQAYALDAQVHTFATVANVLFGVGGALAATGVVLFIVSPSSAGSVALAPAGNGFVLSGAF